MSTLVGERLNLDLSDVAESARASLVRVFSGRRGVGSGVVWISDGVVVTNAHVVERGPLRVELADGRVLTADVVARDAELDVAILHVEEEGLVAAQLGGLSPMRPGELVFAIGHPWGVPGAVTSGVVIGVGEDWPGLPLGASGREWLVVNMRLRPGNSGGPIFDAHGDVVGISTIMAGPEVGMAVPASVAKSLVSRAHLDRPAA